MARAGYNPRALAHMFETIEQESKSGGGGGSPQWLSSHPNPGNRTQYINKEAEALTIAKPADESGFKPTKTALASLPPAKTMAELAKAKGGGATASSVGTPGQPVPAPAADYRDLSGGKVFQASVPSNWTTLASDTAIKAVPQNGYGPLKGGENVFTHGVEFGVAKATAKDLREATNAWLKAIAQGNPELKLAGSQESVQISQRAGLATPLINPSPLGGQERITLYTTFLSSGNLFYYMTIVPEKDAGTYQEAFKRVGTSIRLLDGR
jgi:hypothetical protein